MKNKQSGLMRIPGVGRAVAEDLQSLGIYEVSDLKQKDPEKLYADLCAKQHARIDRCMLYVMRCAVYYASSSTHTPEKLKWWNWKDKERV